MVMLSEYVIICNIGPVPLGFLNAGKSSIISGLLSKKVKCTPESAAHLKFPLSSSFLAVSICLSISSLLRPLLPHYTPLTPLTQDVSVRERKRGKSDIVGGGVGIEESRGGDGGVERKWWGKVGNYS